MVAGMHHNFARWAVSGDERGSKRTNATFSLIRFCADGAMTARVLTISGLLVVHANSSIDQVQGQLRVMSEYSGCVHEMEYGCSIAAARTSARQSRCIRFSYRAKHKGQCLECELPIVVGQQCIETTRDRNLHAD